MGTASFEFLAYAFVVAVVFNFNRSVSWRQLVLLVANLVFLSFFSHNVLAWIPLAGFLVFGFVGLKLSQDGGGKLGLLPLLIAGVGIFIWLKKYTFIPAPLFLHFPYITLGLSYIFFRVLHLIIDAGNGQIEGRVTAVSYLNYTLNFTTLISGPIQRYQDFAKYQLADQPMAVDIISAGRSIERIIIGFFKVNVLSLVFSMLQTHALASLPTSISFDQRLLNGMLIVAAYPLYLYCNFSGYIDMVIGIATFLRIELPENFNRPFSSGNFMTFWSRWHITLSEWLKTYVYSPLLIVLMRRYPARALEPFLGALAIFVTFFLVGVWHGQTSEFVFFGVLQGGGVAGVKLYQTIMVDRLGRKTYKALTLQPVYQDLSRGLTFTWFAFTLLWFWSSWSQVGNVWRTMSAPLFGAAMFGIFVAASIILALWERGRLWLMRFQIAGEPFLLSRYTRTVWSTAAVLIAVVTTLLLNAPAPDLVYKAF